VHVSALEAPVEGFGFNHHPDGQAMLPNVSRLNTLVGLDSIEAVLAIP
jgi:hypothetical protein